MFFLLFNSMLLSHNAIPSCLGPAAQIWMTQRDWRMIGSTSVSTSPTTTAAMSSPSGRTGRTAQSLPTQIVPEASSWTRATGKSNGPLFSPTSHYRGRMIPALALQLLSSLLTPFSLFPVTCTGLTGDFQLKLREPRWVENSGLRSSTAASRRPTA